MFGEGHDVSGDGVNPGIAVKGRDLDFLMVDAENGATESERTQALTSDLEPGTGSATEVENGGTGLDQLVLLLNLNQLEGGASHVAKPLSLLVVEIRRSTPTHLTPFTSSLNLRV